MKEFDHDNVKFKGRLTMRLTLRNLGEFPERSVKFEQSSLKSGDLYHFRNKCKFCLVQDHILETNGENATKPEKRLYVDFVKRGKVSSVVALGRPWAYL